MIKKRLIFILLFLLAVGYAGYHAFGGKDDAELMTPPPASVKVLEIMPEDKAVTEEYPGRTVGSREVEVRARVTGILQKRTYVEGSRVQKDDLLFVIDDAPLRAERQQIQARYDAALKDFNRSKSLWDKRVISARSLDEARATYEQLKAQLDTAAINLNYTQVNAPISGVTSKESLSEGSLVTENESLLTRITQLDPIYVNFGLPDADRLMQSQIAMPVAAPIEGEIKPAEAKPSGTPEGPVAMPEPANRLSAEIHFGDGSAYPLKGTVDFTDSVIDPQTGTIRARAVFPNPETALFPGQFVRLQLTGLPRKSAITVPDTAIMQGPEGPFVFIVDEKGMAGVAPVKLGEVNAGNRFIEGGLKQGDKVIIDGMIKVRPGSPVAIDTGAAPAANAQPGGAHP